MTERLSKDVIERGMFVLLEPCQSVVVLCTVMAEHLDARRCSRESPCMPSLFLPSPAM